MKQLLAIVLMAAAVAACGSERALPDAGDLESLPPVPTPCTSFDDLDAIVTLLRTGQPTYDYQPAANIAQLIEESDVAVKGAINSAVRTKAGERSHTTLNISDAEVLAGSAADIDRFGLVAEWPSGQEPDPLLEPVQFSDLEFVAILNESAPAPGGYEPAVEGLIVSCTGTPVATMSIIQPPPGSNGIPLGEFADLVAES